MRAREARREHLCGMRNQIGPRPLEEGFQYSAENLATQHRGQDEDSGSSLAEHDDVAQHENEHEPEHGVAAQAGYIPRHLLQPCGSDWGGQIACVPKQQENMAVVSPSTTSSAM